MEFKNYCIVVMGVIGDIEKDLSFIAEGKPTYVDAKGVLISTFTSLLTPNQLGEFFKQSDKRSFFIFDLDDESSASHLDEERLHNHLFDSITSTSKLDDMNERMGSNLSATTNNLDRTIQRQRKINDIRISNLETTTKAERQIMINEILDKGLENLTSVDKAKLKEISEFKV